MRITVNELNKKYRSYFKNTMTSNKNRFGWYSVTLTNGRVIVGSTLKDIEENIKKEIERGE